MLVERRIPLPLRKIKNQRSLLGVQNLVDLIWLCITHPKASGETFLASDCEDLSTPDLIQRLARTFGRPPRFLGCPLVLVRIVARLIHQENQLNRLCESLQIDPKKTQQVLGWRPPVSVDEGLRKSVNWYLQTKK